ncbi:hypothetical protein BDR03DRAFT_565422 [Suillus americanus]|nr:hypothetical protein BDR03DRAFT_565422 [Suillus americanus]
MDPSQSSCHHDYYRPRHRHWLPYSHLLLTGCRQQYASAGLTVYSVCLLTITLVLAADKAAQRILSNEPRHMPAAPTDDDADSSNPLFVNDITSAAPQSVEPSHLQPFLSPSQSHLIEPMEIVSAPISTCTPCARLMTTPPPLRPSLSNRIICSHLRLHLHRV